MKKKNPLRNPLRNLSRSLSRSPFSILNWLTPNVVSQFSILLAALLLIACSDNISSPVTVGGAIMATAADANWPADAAIGLYTLQSGTDQVYNNQSNLRYLNVAPAGKAAYFQPADDANTAVFPRGEEKIDILAYYPQAGSSGSAANSRAANFQLSTFNFQLNVADQSDIAAIDLMTTDRVSDCSEAQPAVPLIFHHRLAKLVLTLQADQSIIDEGIDLSAVTFTLSGTPTRATYNLLTQTITETSDVADIQLNGRVAIIIPSSGGGSEALHPSSRGSEALHPSSRAGEAPALIIRIGDDQFTTPLTGDGILEPGTITTARITLTSGATGQVAIDTSVSDWTIASPSTDLTVEVAIDPNNLDALPKTPATIELKYTPATGDATLATYNWALKEGSTTQYEHTLANGSAPIYWENITAGASSYPFTLTFTPTADGTPVKDILAGTATVTAHGTQPTFALAHANSQICVKLAKGNTYTDAEWEAIIALSKLETDAKPTTLTFSGLGQASGTTYTANYAYPDDSGTGDSGTGNSGTGNSSSAFGLSAIFAPQATLSATDDKITVSTPAVTYGSPAVTLPANTVNVLLKNLTSKLEAGKKYNITIIVDKTTVGTGTINVADWKTVTGNGSIEY